MNDLANGGGFYSPGLSDPALPATIDPLFPLLGEIDLIWLLPVVAAFAVLWVRYFGHRAFRHANRD